jgi:hypothetical protein
VTTLDMDLHPAASDTMSAGRFRTCVQATGHMTAGTELCDSVTSQPVAQAVDRAGGSCMGGRCRVPIGVTNPVGAPLDRETGGRSALRVVDQNRTTIPTVASPCTTIVPS